jgi:hypothetical protein
MMNKSKSIKTKCPNRTVWKNELGDFHRLDGPAIIWDNEEWWVDGKRHRINGPACEYVNGTKKFWFTNDQYITVYQ